MSLEDAEEPHVVLDNGSRNIKAGMAGLEAPTVLFPNVVGNARALKQAEGIEAAADRYIGDHAQSQRHMLSLAYPMEHGIVRDWCAMEEVWNYLYNSKLQVSPSEASLLITEPSLNPRCNREKMSEVWFEKFQVPRMAIANPGMLAVYAAGRVSAVSLECGDGVCQVVPIYEGYTDPHAIKRFDFGGRDLTTHLSTLLRSKGFTFSTTAEMEIVRDMKEKLCYTALDFEQEMTASSTSSSTEKSYELPDGSVVTVGNERFRVPECMFQPALHSPEAGEAVLGVHQMVFACLQDCDIDMRCDLSVNIIVSGGGTLFPGFAERLDIEIRKLMLGKRRLRVVARDGAYLVWIGGSVLASLSVFPNLCRTKADYEEYGPVVLERQLF